MATFLGKRAAWLAPFVSGSLWLAACELDPAVITTDAGTSESDGGDARDVGADAQPPDDDGGGGDTALADAAVPDSTALARTEADWIVYMREEEKLARDVYRAYASMAPIFRNTANSEQQHMDAVAVLLERYRLPDPAAGMAQGEFTNVDLAALYTRLVGQGSASRVEAFKVGAEIEELDLADLAAAGEVVEHRDVNAVFENLGKGSRNHLRAFDAQLRALGVSYVPSHLDAQTYAEIASSPMETGRAF